MVAAFDIDTGTPVEARGFFSVRDAVTGAITFELDFANFSQDIADALANGRRLKDFRAVGGCDAGSNTLSAVIACAVIR